MVNSVIDQLWPYPKKQEEGGKRMDYYKAFVKLYGAAGAAIEELYKAHVVPPEVDNAIKILKEAITEVEEMDK